MIYRHMGYEHTIVDASTPAAITAALKKVNASPALRIAPGMKALVRTYQSPNHTMRRTDLEEEFGALDLHFGWLCRRVAEELGANEPDALALVDYGTDTNGHQTLTVKPAVATALAASGLKPKHSN